MAFFALSAHLWFQTVDIRIAAYIDKVVGSVLERRYDLTDDTPKENNEHYNWIDIRPHNPP